MFDLFRPNKDPLSLCHSDSSMIEIPKRNPSALCARQPYTVQIIQLVEGPPPPRRPIIDLYESSSYTSSESSEEEEEESCSSYCSSEDPVEQPPANAEGIDKPCLIASPDTYSLRMKRILAWRENFSSQLSATIAEPSLSSTLKRKLQCNDQDYDSDVLSRSSKRSRSSRASSQGGTSAGSSLGEHSCPACDACFDSRQDLRQHGREAGANEACFVAVEYAFE